MFRLTVKKLARKKSFEEIIETLESENMPLSLNARFTIRNILSGMNHAED